MTETDHPRQWLLWCGTCIWRKSLRIPSLKATASHDDTPKIYSSISIRQSSKHYLHTSLDWYMWTNMWCFHIIPKVYIGASHIIFVLEILTLNCFVLLATEGAGFLIYQKTEHKQNIPFLYEQTSRNCTYQYQTCIGLQVCFSSSIADKNHRDTCQKRPY